jgi:hypothetical protein
MHQAILSGLLNDAQSISDIKGNCSAEACRWDGYTTLAICAAIEDVSSKIELRNDTSGYASARISGTSWQPPDQSLSYRNTNFWMAAPFKDSANVTDGNLPSISDIFVTYYPPCDDQNEARQELDWLRGSFIASNWKAMKGTLSLCLQTLKSEYNTTMETTVVDTHTDVKWKLVSEYQVCLAEPFNGENFCVGTSNLRQWSSSLKKSLESAAEIQAGGDNYYTGQWVPQIVQDILGPTVASCDPSQDPGFGLTAFKRRTNNIAIAMSNALRTGNTTSPESIVNGSEWFTEQYIFVDFRWLFVPAAIYLAITFFFLATVVKSRKSHNPLWKSSPQVVLHVADRGNGMQGTLDKVEKEFEKVQVQLQYNGERW